MRFRPEVKVGLIVFLGLVALVIIYWFFGGLGFRAGNYQICAIFDDVMRLSRGTDIRMAGVRVGMVQDITLTEDKRARVIMLINKKYEDAIPKDSTARVTTGGVIGVGEYYVEILPGSSRAAIKNNECLRTVRMPTLDDVLPDVTELVSGLKRTISSVNDVIDNPKVRASLKNIVANTDTTTRNMSELTGDVRALIAQNGAEIGRIIANIDSASRDFAGLSQEVSRIVTSKRPDIDQTLANVRSASEDFASFSRILRRTLEDGGAGDVGELISSAKSTVENLEVVSKQLRVLAEDETIAAQVRETIKNASVAAKGAADIVDRVGKIVGVGKPSVRPPRVTEPISEIGSQLDALIRTEDNSLRLDYNYRLAAPGNRFYRLGLLDFGHKPKLNAQAGGVIDDLSAYRYGIYASRIGIGYDRILGDNLRLNLDLYHPDDPRLETKIRYDFAPDLGIWAGTDDLFDGEGMVGLQYRR
ncbi:MAG: MlaD family protein [Armatimonadota bacterium]